MFPFLYSSFKKKQIMYNNLWEKNIHWKKEKQQQQKRKIKSNITRRRWNRTTEHVSSPTDLKSALHTSEDHPRLKKLKTLLNNHAFMIKQVSWSHANVLTRSKGINADVKPNCYRVGLLTTSTQILLNVCFATSCL